MPATKLSLERLETREVPAALTYTWVATTPGSTDTLSNMRVNGQVPTEAIGGDDKLVLGEGTANCELGTTELDSLEMNGFTGNLRTHADGLTLNGIESGAVTKFSAGIGGTLLLRGSGLTLNGVTEVGKILFLSEFGPRTVTVGWAGDARFMTGTITSLAANVENYGQLVLDNTITVFADATITNESGGTLTIMTGSINSPTGKTCQIVNHGDLDKSGEVFTNEVGGLLNTGYMDVFGDVLDLVGTVTHSGYTASLLNLANGTVRLFGGGNWIKTTGDFEFRDGFFRVVPTSAGTLMHDAWVLSRTGDAIFENTWFVLGSGDGMMTLGIDTPMGAIYFGEGATLFVTLNYEAYAGTGSVDKIVGRKMVNDPFSVLEVTTFGKTLTGGTWTVFDGDTTQSSNDFGDYFLPPNTTQYWDGTNLEDLVIETIIH